MLITNMWSSRIYILCPFFIQSRQKCSYICLNPFFALHPPKAITTFLIILCRWASPLSKKRGLVRGSGRDPLFFSFLFEFFKKRSPYLCTPLKRFQKHVHYTSKEAFKKKKKKKLATDAFCFCATLKNG